MSNIVVPEVDKDAFSCPHCGTYSQQHWQEQGQYSPYRVAGLKSEIAFKWASCSKCKKVSVWIEEIMVYPRSLSAPEAHQNMPEELRELYNEARLILNDSPRAATALLRLVIEKLVFSIDVKATNLNAAIGELVQQGLPTQVQQALDVCRVTGNEAVHAGAITIDDTFEVAYPLFQLINFVVEKMIAEPAQIDEMYNSLPKGKLDGIKNRDKKK
ncbi:MULTISPECIES: DUF4145 domain-containing protein [unclassified Maridesulfovibrio]|uniref:DUF4145 domain-containing protein n=1 Tax=unclassified Maridesulfovibrio TaxID=2794999 RepID=UPI003B400830